MSKTLTLEQKIAAARNKLQKAYEASGYTDSIVLAASVELDELLNIYQKKMLEKTFPGFKTGTSKNNGKMN